jgi:hypothetical protein
VVLPLQLQLPHICCICKPAACCWAHDVEAQLLPLVTGGPTEPVGSKLLRRAIAAAMRCLSSMLLLVVWMRGIALQPYSSVTCSHAALDIARPLPHLLLLRLLLLWLSCTLLLLIMLPLLVVWIKLLLLLLLVQLH